MNTRQKTGIAIISAVFILLIAGCFWAVGWSAIIAICIDVVAICLISYGFHLLENKK